MGGGKNKMNCISPIQIILRKNTNVKENKPKRIIMVPCNKCIQCKIARAKEWSNRLMDEAMLWDRMCIVVLTYSNKDMPMGVRTKHGRYGTLRHRDVQLWLKKVRKRLGKRKIKYYVAGEYGGKTKRPHYHVIIYGMNGLKSRNDRNIINQSWEYGQVLWDVKRRPITKKAVAYVAQYVQKKMYGENGHYYMNRGIREPQNYGSHGLGKEIALRERKRFIENGLTYGGKNETSLRTPEPVSKYYIKIWKRQDCEEAVIELKKGNYVKAKEIINNGIIDVIMKEYTNNYRERLKLWRKEGLNVEYNDDLIMRNGKNEDIIKWELNEAIKKSKLNEKKWKNSRNSIDI